MPPWLKSSQNTNPALAKMAKHHKTHHRTPWKRDIVLITSILHIHCLPPPTYTEFFLFLTKTWPSAMSKLYASEIPQPSTANVDKEIEQWLACYLKENYEVAEKTASEIWTTVRDIPRKMVEGLLKATGLKAEVMQMEEMLLQVKWKREGDWRYGSTPDIPDQPTKTTELVVKPLGVGEVKPLEVGEDKSASVSIARKIARDIFQILHARTQRTAEKESDRKRNTCSKNFAEQLMELKAVGEEGCVGSGNVVGWVGMRS